MRFSQILFICDHCGKQFRSFRYRLKYKKHFCSLQCSLDHRKGENHPGWKGGKKIRICQFCKKEFKVHEKPSIIKKGEGKYCSKGCADKAKKGTGSYSRIDEIKARELFDQYKDSKFSLDLFSKGRGYSSAGLSKVFNEYFPDEFEMIKEQKITAKNEWYKKGRRFEYTVKNYLKSKGFWTLRSPGSAGPVDLIAIKKGLILLVQCKCRPGLSKMEKEELLRLSESTGSKPILAYRETPHKFKFRECLNEGYLDIEI